MSNSDLKNHPTYEELTKKSPENKRYLPADKVYLQTAINLTPKGYCQWCGKSLAGTRSRRFCPPVKTDDWPYKNYECAMTWRIFWQSTAAFKKAVMIRDNFTCQLCGTVCVAENKHGVKIPELGKIEIDHIVPVAKGGNADLSNLQTLCKKCNRSKGTKREFTPQPTLF